MKKIAIAVVLSTLFGSASAINTEPAQAASNKSTTKPVVETPSNPVKPAAAAAKTANSPLINPFNGKALSAEQIQRELEAAKAQTQMLEEQLKQMNITEEMRNVPLRKQVEAAQATTLMKKEEASQNELEVTSKAKIVAAKAALEAASKPQPKVDAPKQAASSKKAASKPAGDKKTEGEKSAEAEKSKGEQKNVEKTSESQRKTTTPVRPTLVSVISVGTQSSVVLDIAGNTLVVKDGEMTPFGPLRIVDESTADVGGTKLTVHGATLSRFVVTDTKPATGPNGAPVAAPTTVAPAAPAASTSNPATNATTNPRTALPPLQLPPGVSVLPAPR